MIYQRADAQPVHYLCKMMEISKSLDIIQSQCQTNNVTSLIETHSKSRWSHSWLRVGVLTNLALTETLFAYWVFRSITDYIHRFYSLRGITLTFPPWLRGWWGSCAVGSTLFLFLGFCLYFRLFLLHLHWLRLFLWLLLLHQRWSSVVLSLQTKRHWLTIPHKCFSSCLNFVCFPPSFQCFQN